jgi:threonyl-tRNA synthetase
MLVIGDKEVESGTVAPRYRDGKNLSVMSAEGFVEFIKNEAINYR